MKVRHKMNKLNLGSGNDIRKGFINLDYENYKGVDVLFDLSKLEQGEKLPFSDRQFDLIICYDVLEHFSNITPILREIDRVCNIGGLIEIKVPCGKWVWDNLDHKRQFNWNSLNYKSFQLKRNEEDNLKIVYRKKYLLPSRNIFYKLARILTGKVNLYVIYEKLK